MPVATRIVRARSRFTNAPGVESMTMGRTTRPRASVPVVRKIGAHAGAGLQTLRTRAAITQVDAKLPPMQSVSPIASTAAKSFISAMAHGGRGTQISIQTRNPNHRTSPIASRPNPL